ncbi:GNAT family N-acetyltransferase [Lysinibacillus fusiformis]|jgi:predicted GNAT family N-acyltransferase|uniref:GNAT family N-acetyltransferase n=1 Tax=Lysinibacillus TaxID=400634 RepID=UPI0004D56D3F|nr:MULTISPECIES: GNAT family N-acetyltransferase [Lysinibacillus]MDC6269925.1 GNAT family N-acetyltransferase [Lysinibacillus sphaericus]AJK89684.1 acetyltransferase [Lysinibacillus fusiformis]KHK54336.1 acetyltransferase [Lysinibacillus sp. A1]MCT6818184.1 GNAT family N-acetyltransferase [Lysinibacillus fusiformis]MCT6929970.1 GNAT family N-acetyltransferase [Lysinibacillus fusiformis]
MHTDNKTALELVELDQYDILGLIELSASVGWDYDEYEIRTVMSSGKIFGHKNTTGKIVSSAAIIPYDTNLASIGMVIVNKEYRGLGLGKKVTQKCIDSVSKDTSIMLISTEDGKPLYETLGFITVGFVQKFLSNSYIHTETFNNQDITIEKYNENDFNKIVELDSGAFGDMRKSFLFNRIKQSKQCLVARNQKGKIIGFGLSILGPINLILGPIVAPDSQTAAMIIDKLAINHQGKLRIDVASSNNELMFFLQKSGFVKVSEPPLMIKNSLNMPYRNKELFAIAAQIFG